MATNPQVTVPPSPLTLPNVIHFLQTESSRYERDRNYWELERAEMKARIAKLEGERKSNERMKDWYLRRLRMLELALHEERLRINPSTKLSPSVVEDSEHTGKKSKFGRVGRNEHDETYMGMIRASQSALHDHAGRNKSRAYLEKCLTEVTYLVNAHPAITANKLVSPPPPPFKTGSESPPQSVTGPRPMRNYTARDVIDSKSQINSAPVLNGHVSESNTNGVHLMSSRPSIDEVEESAEFTTDDEPVVRIQHIFDSQGNFVEPLKVHTASVSSQAAINRSVSDSEANDDWDFGEGETSQVEELSTKTLSLSKVTQILPSTVKCIAVLQTSNDDRWTASVGITFEIYIHRNDAIEPFLILHGHEAPIHSLLLHQEGESQEVTLYSAGDDMVIRKWFWNAQSARNGEDPSTKITPAVTFISHSQSIRNLVIVGSDLLSCSDDASTRRWDTNTGDSKRVWRIPGPPTGVAPKLLCRLNETSFATGYSDGSIKVYDIKHEKSTTTLHKTNPEGKKNEAITAMASLIFMQQPFLCVAFENGELRIYNAKTGTIIESKSFSESVTCLCALQARAQFVVVTSDNKMQVLSYRGRQICTLDPTSSTVNQESGASDITCLASSPANNDAQTCVVSGDSMGFSRVYK